MFLFFIFNSFNDVLSFSSLGIYLHILKPTKGFGENKILSALIKAAAEPLSRPP